MDSGLECESLIKKKNSGGRVGCGWLVGTGSASLKVSCLLSLGIYHPGLEDGGDGSPCWISKVPPIKASEFRKLKAW